MPLDFAVIETTSSPLWDHGWFDLTRFAVGGPPAERQEPGSVFRDFLRDPVAQRSFCDPGPWGEAIRRHGPFPCDTLRAEWFRPIDHRLFREAVIGAFGDPGVTGPPDDDQRQPVETWIEAVTARGDDLFALEVPDQQGARIDWSDLWTVYREFASLSPDRAELTLGVIGYD